MELETIRALTDFFNDGALGVNARIPGVQLDTGDAAPALLATIVDETRSPLAARGQLPKTRPCLVVSAHDHWDVQGEVATAERDTEGEGLPVLIRIACDEAASDRGLRDLYYQGRAVMQAIKAFLSNEHAAAWRTRNQVQILQALKIRKYRVYMAGRTQEDAADKGLVYCIIIYFEVRDIAP